MAQVLESVAGICVVLAAAELISRLCSENAMVNFVRALAVLVMLLSVIAPLFSLDFDLELPMEKTRTAGEELTQYVEKQTEEAAREELEQYLTGLLAAAGIETEKIQVGTDIREDGSIVLTEVDGIFPYEADRERAQVLLKNVLGNDVKVEGKSNGP